MKNLIDRDFLERLEELSFIFKGRRRAHLSGSHSFPRSGVGIEFADFREYAPGDDFRYIDWNTSARLDRLMVKTFVREFTLPIYVLLDLSASMQLGQPEKATYAARLALALSYLGLEDGDRVGLFPFAADLFSPVLPRHGPNQIGRMLAELREAEPEGKTSIDEAVEGFLRLTEESGLVIIISDLLLEGGYEEGLARLLHRGDDLVAIQILSPEEMEPEVSGQLRLEGVESNRSLEVNTDRGAVEDYVRNFRRYQEDLNQFFSSRGVPYLVTETDFPLHRLINERMRAEGILQ